MTQSALTLSRSFFSPGQCDKIEMFLNFTLQRFWCWFEVQNPPARGQRISLISPQYDNTKVCYNWYLDLISINFVAAINITIFDILFIALVSMSVSNSSHPASLAFKTLRGLAWATDVCVTPHTRLSTCWKKKPWFFSQFGVFLPPLFFLSVHLTRTSSPSYSCVCLHCFCSVVTVAYFPHLSKSAVWLSHASVPVLQRLGRKGSVRDMEAIHACSAVGWVISTCTVWVRQQ